MSKSIISNKRECLVCKITYDLHRHHIYFGAGYRKLSEKNGCWCYLCARHHNMSNKGVHFNRDLDLRLKEECQRRWEDERGTRAEFISIFGKNYL